MPTNCYTIVYRKKKQPPQVDVDARSNHLAEVEMKRMHFHGIDIRIVINEIRSPRLDDLPQFTVKVITEQGRQRCVFLENGLC